MNSSRHLAACVCLIVAFTLEPVLAQNVNVTTWHNDLGRTGQNNSETILTETVVSNINTFGKICSQTGVDGKIYAQPLVVSNVMFNGGPAKTVVYIATQNDTVYAIDGTNCNILKSISLLVNPSQGEVAAQCKDIGAGCNTITPEVGILGTPVIELDSTNPAAGTLYAVADSECPPKTACAQNGVKTFFHRLHALNLTDLTEVTAYGSPVQICASGCGGFTGRLFSQQHIQRPGLLWLSAQQAARQNNMVYIAFSMMDGTPGYPPGFLFSFNAQNFADQTSQFTYETTPGISGQPAHGGGVWQAGAGLASGQDASGSYFIYFATADGTFDLISSGPDAGNTFLKVTPTLQPAPGANYFTPSDQCYRASEDLDFGSGGTVLIPDGTLPDHPYLAIMADKENYLWMMDRTTPASPGFDPGQCQQVMGCPLEGVPVCPASQWANHNFYSFNFAANNQARATPAFWSGNGNIYIAGTYTPIERFPVANPCPTSPCTPAAQTPLLMGFSTTPSVSSNYSNGKYSNGIVWALKNPGDPPTPSGPGPAVLYAFDANTLHRLYNSSMCPTGADEPGLATKFSVPTIANGYVYIGTQTDFDIYGPLTRSGC